MGAWNFVERRVVAGQGARLRPAPRRPRRVAAARPRARRRSTTRSSPTSWTRPSPASEPASETLGWLGPSSEGRSGRAAGQQSSAGAPRRPDSPFAPRSSDDLWGRWRLRSVSVRQPFGSRGARTKALKTDVIRDASGSGRGAGSGSGCRSARPIVCPSRLVAHPEPGARRPHRSWSRCSVDPEVGSRPSRERVKDGPQHRARPGHPSSSARFRCIGGFRAGGPRTNHSDALKPSDGQDVDTGLVIVNV